MHFNKKHDISTDDDNVDRSSTCHLHAAWSVCPQIGDIQEDLEGPLSIVMIPRILTSTTSSHSSEYVSSSTARGNPMQSFETIDGRFSPKVDV